MNRLDHQSPPLSPTWGRRISMVVAMEGEKLMIVTNAEGQRMTPSMVAYAKNGDMLVGQITKRQAVVNPENTFSSMKRFIGRKMRRASRFCIELWEMRMEMWSWIVWRLGSKLWLRRFLLRYEGIRIVGFVLFCVFGNGFLSKFLLFWNFNYSF